VEEKNSFQSRFIRMRFLELTGQSLEKTRPRPSLLWRRRCPWSSFSPLFWVAYDGSHSKTLPFSCLPLWPLKKDWEHHQGTFQAVLNGLAIPLALNVHSRSWNYKDMIYATVLIRTSGPYGLESGLVCAQQ
jgi:hypothetical protein